MVKNLLNYIPKKYKNAVIDFYKDCDGYWLTVGNGYALEGYYSEQVIHEDSINNSLTVLRGHLVRKVQQ